MRSIKCLFIGNEHQTFGTVLEYAAKVPWISVACNPLNAREARHYLQDFEVDVLFCDISTLIDNEMQIFLLRNQGRLQIVVSATKAELADNDIVCNVFSFLPKPVSFDSFYKVLCRAKEYLLPVSDSALPNMFDF